ncbi:MAG: cytidylate kinase-like family protein [Syntrophobacteraceae bacterium]
MAVVTVSRDLGSGGREVAWALEKDPGYRYLDHEAILERIKSAGHRWEKWAQDFDEHPPRLWEKYDWSYRGFTALVQSTILDEACEDRVTIIGRGGNYLLRDTPFALSIRVTAPLEARVARFAEREAVDRDSARWLIEKTDRERAGFLYTVYERDGKDPTDYDMVFNSGQMSVEDITAAVREEMLKKDLLRDENSVEALRMKALAARIKSRVLTALPFFMPTLEVEHTGGSLHLRGVVHLPRERDMVLHEAKALAGPVPVTSELRYRH